MSNPNSVSGSDSPNTLAKWIVVPGPGLFVINLAIAATEETRVGFWVLN